MASAYSYPPGSLERLGEALSSQPSAAICLYAASTLVSFKTRRTPSAVCLSAECASIASRTREPFWAVGPLQPTLAAARSRAFPTLGVKFCTRSFRVPWRVCAFAASISLQTLYSRMRCSFVLSRATLASSTRSLISVSSVVGTMRTGTSAKSACCAAQRRSPPLTTKPSGVTSSGLRTPFSLMLSSNRGSCWHP